MQLQSRNSWLLGTALRNFGAVALPGLAAAEAPWTPVLHLLWGGLTHGATAAPAVQLPVLQSHKPKIGLMLEKVQEPPSVM